MDETHFIESIFNYCNRRCEHCAFTERCRLFQRPSRLRPPASGPKSVRTDPRQVPGSASASSKRWCEREGIDFEGLQRDAHSEEADARMDRVERAVRSDPLQKLATTYTHATFRLIDGLSAARALRSWPREVDAAVETIGWYAGMVGAKVYRALHGFAERNDAVRRGCRAERLERLREARAADRLRVAGRMGRRAGGSAKRRRIRR